MSPCLICNREKKFGPLGVGVYRRPERKRGGVVEKKKGGEMMMVVSTPFYL